VLVGENATLPLQCFAERSFAAPSRAVTGEDAVPREDAEAEAREARRFVEESFARYHAEIYGFLARMVRDSELAADLAQDTFVKAYRAYDTLEDREKTRAWLYSIANRAALDELRHRRVIRFVPWSGESRGASQSAEATVLHGQMSGEMERALARIPERQRAALILAEVQDLTGLELAAAMNSTHIAVRALLTRARDNLREALLDERAQSTAREKAADAARAKRERA
jgi:RNA polymerase sigma-70 factor (ECF subfamily)